MEEERVKSSRTDTGLGCGSPLSCSCLSPLMLSSTTTLLFTTSMIFFSAFKSSSHFSNASSNFLLFSAADSVAASASVVGRFSGGDFNVLERRISAGRVGLLGTSQEILVTLPLTGIFSSWSDEEEESKLTFFSCFFPAVQIH